jgi:chromosome segregation ATPase
VQARIVYAECERHAAEQKLSICLLDFDKKESLLRTLKRSVEELTSEYEHASKQAQEFEQRLKESTIVHSQTLLDLQTNVEAERLEHANEVDKLTRKLSEREEILRKAQREASEQQQRAENLENDYKQRYTKQLQELTQKYQQLRSTSANNARQQDVTENQKTIQDQKLGLQLEHIQSQLSQVTREKEVLHERTLELEDSLTAGHRKYGKLQSESMQTIASLTDELAATRQTAASLQQRLDEQASRVSQLALKADHLEAAKLQAQEDRHELVAALKAAKLQLQALDGQWMDKCEHLKHSLKQQLDKEKKKGEVYKSKALDAHNKWKEAATVAAALASKSQNAQHIYLQQQQQPPHPQPVAADPNNNLRTQAHIDALERKCEAFELSIGKQRIREDDLIQTLANVRLELQTVSDQKQRVFDRVNELDAAKKQLMLQVQTLEASLRREQERVNELEHSKQGLSIALTHAESASKHAAEKQLELDSARRDLLLTVEGLEATVRKDADRIGDLERRNKSLQQALENCEMSLKRESDRANALTGNQQQMQGHLSSLEYNHRRETERASEIETSKRSLQLQLQACEQSLRLEIEQKNSGLQAQSLLKDENEKLRSRIADLDRTVSSLQLQYKQTHLESLELTNRRQSSLGLEHELSIVKEENALLHQRLQGLNTEMMTLRSKPLELTRQYTLENDSLKAEISQLHRKNSDLSEENSTLKSKNMELTQRPDHEREYASLKLENSTLTRRISDLNAELLANQQLESGAHHQLTVLREENERLKQKAANFDSSQRSLEAAANEYNLRKQQLENELVKLRQENMMLKQRLADVTPELLLLRDQMSSLEFAVMQDAAVPLTARKAQQQRL